MFEWAEISLPCLKGGGPPQVVERYINIDKYYVFIYIYPKKNLSVTLRWQLPLGKGGNVNICAVKIYPKFSETTLILQPA